MDSKAALEKAIEIKGSQSALARAIRVSQPAIHNALKRGGTMSRRSAIRIERVTKGEVPRAAICPALAKPAERVQQ